MAVPEPDRKENLEPLLKFLDAVLKRHGLSDRAFGRQFGIASSTMTQIRKCVYYPRHSTIAKLASAISQLPNENVTAEDLYGLIKSDNATENLSAVNQLDDMCVLYLAQIIDDEFRQRGMDTRDPAHFRQFTDAAPTLWQRSEDLILLRQLIDGALPARFLTKELFASLVLTLRRWTGDTEKYDLETFLQVVITNSDCVTDSEGSSDRSPLLN